MNNDINSSVNALLFDIDQEILENGRISDNTLDLLNILIVDLTDRIGVSFKNEVSNASPTNTR